MAKRTYTTILFQPDGTAEVKLNQPKPTLATMQKAVGGLIEAVDFFAKRQISQHITAYANEEGICLGLEPNPNGSRAVTWHSMIYGPIFVYFTSTNQKAERWFECFAKSLAR